MDALLGCLAVKIRISALDKLFSQYIRRRDAWTCQRCHKHYQPPTNALHNSHVFSRGGMSTRFDPRNCFAMCYGCHSFLGRNPLEHYAWYIARCGQQEFDLLRYRYKHPAKIDRAVIKFWLQQELKMQASTSGTQIP